MLTIEGVRVPPDVDISAAKMAYLRHKTARLLRIREEELLSVRVLRRGLDARKDPVFVYTLRVELRHGTRDEARIIQRCTDRRVKMTDSEPVWNPPPVRWNVPSGGALSAGTCDVKPVVTGAGPAGLFAALILARAGLRPVLLERGRPMEQRCADVEHFRRTGELNPSSNVAFGEGGAGAFSDGKLHTGTRNIRHRFILEQFVRYGAPESILTDANPHIGTDYLRVVLCNMRNDLLSLGADIRFEHTLTRIHTADGQLCSVTVSAPSGTYEQNCRNLILCPGHSARDTFQMLYDTGIPMEPKAFAAGVRMEHRQCDCDAAQYRTFAGHPGLPPSSYQLSCHTENGRGVFSFCVCPGGEVIAAASEPGQVVTNGMSEYARNGENINGALLVSVTPEDFGNFTPDGGKDVLAGIAFQRRMEKAAFELGGGGFYAPAQRVEDFLAHRPSTEPGRVRPTYRPGVIWTDLHRCLPEFVSDAIEQALPVLGRRLSGYDHPDAVMTAVESRSSSPVRIVRDGNCQSTVRGLYPCGEGAGYAGGIMSAAADGILCAEQVCAALR